MITITPAIAIQDWELSERFIRASGPGGQNVNQVATAVQLRFHVANSPSLPFAMKQRALALAGTRATNDGEIIITARAHRTQERNRADARERLVDLLRRAATTPRARKMSQPSRAAKAKRLEQKKKRSDVKRSRAPVRSDDG